jgi:hypothetical protein
MKTITSSARFFLLAILLKGSGLLVTAAIPGPVSQAWAVRIDGPTNTYLQVSGMSVGPSGDVFLAGSVRRADYIHDVFVTRRSATGALVWQKVYEPAEGPSGNEQALGVVARGTNVYVTGAITTEIGTQDFLTLKYRDTGELEWAARWDGPGHSSDLATAVAVDAQGNVLVLGGSTGTNSSLDVVVLKYGPTGNLLWTYSYDSPEHGADRGVGLRLDAAGNTHVAGTSEQSSEQSSVFTLKVDPDGRELWTARETSTSVYGVTALSLALDAAGNVVTVGNERFYVATWKYDANGNRQWTARYRAEDPASMYAVDVRFDPSGNIIAAANLYGSGVNDAVLIKYAADGRQLWATRIADPTGTAHLNTLDVDGEGSSYLTVSPNSDVITVKVSPDGAQLWRETYNSRENFSDYGEFLKVTPSGDVFVAGRSTFFTEAFVSLVKYTQQPGAGVATATVTPALQVVDPGSDVLFTAVMFGPEPSQLQWRMNGRPIAGATHATLTLSNVQAFQRGDYSVSVSSLAGATISPEARLSVRTPPEVAIAPTETVAYIGSDAAFASVAGNDFATLQWRHNGINIPGASNEIFRIETLNAADSGAYDVVVSTLGGTITSSAAGLRISDAVRLVGTTPHRSSYSTWEYAPQLRVMPTGQFLIAARSNHLLGASIVLHKHAADGGLLWTTSYETNEFTNAEPARVSLDGAGNIYVTGLSRQPYINAALAVLKYDADGQLLWSRILAGTNVWGSLHAFAVAPQGHSAIAVRGVSETKVIRYNSPGDVEWSFVEPSSTDNGTIALAVDASGNTYLGTTIRVGGDYEIRLRKFDATGATLWTRPYAEGHYNWLSALAIDAAGHLIVAGTGELDGIPDSRMFVQKYSPGGQKLWETRTGSSWSELSYIPALAVGPGDEITVLTMSDDDYALGEQSGVTRIGADGQLKYRIAEPQVLLSNQAQLALDDFGNAYVTGYGSRVALGADAVTAKYDADGNRHWLVYHDEPVASWQYGLAVGADAAGDIRVLATRGTSSDSSAEYSVLHYRQRDPASKLRLQLIPDAAGTFHLSTPADEPFQIEASADLQNWSVLAAGEMQSLLQPGATTFSAWPQRFFRLVRSE